MSHPDVIERSSFPVLPDDDGIRPAGKPDACFYCQTRVGNHHRIDCACLGRAAVFDIELHADRWDSSWPPVAPDRGTPIGTVTLWSGVDQGDDDIIFHRNYGNWCTDNLLDDIDAGNDRATIDADWLPRLRSISLEEGCACGYVYLRLRERSDEVVRSVELH